MQIVILTGDYGTRLSEETSIRPKPMESLANDGKIAAFKHKGF